MLYVVKDTEVKALVALARLASKEQTRPTLMCERLVVEDGRMRAYVTDSYKLARYDAASSLTAEDGAVTVNAKALATALKGAKWAQLETVDAGDRQALRIKTDSGATTELLEYESRYPDCEQLLKDERKPVTAGWVNPAYLSDVCAVSKAAFGSNAPISIETHEIGAWRIKSESADLRARLECVLMPVRPPKRS